MRGPLANHRIWILALLALSWLMVHSIRYNWNVHARFSLLLHGHVFCQFQSPSEVQHPPTASAGFVSKWVYMHGVCIGFLNRYADFVSKSEAGNWDPVSSGGVTVEALLFYSEWAFLIMFTGMCAYRLWSLLKPAPRR